MNSKKQRSSYRGAGRGWSSRVPRRVPVLCLYPADQMRSVAPGTSLSYNLETSSRSNPPLILRIAPGVCDFFEKPPNFIEMLVGEAGVEGRPDHQGVAREVGDH